MEAIIRTETHDIIVRSFTTEDVVHDPHEAKGVLLVLNEHGEGNGETSTFIPRSQVWLLRTMLKSAMASMGQLDPQRRNYHF